ITYSAVFLYVMDRFAAAGIANVRWVSCLFGTSYRSGGGDSFHTPELLSRLWAVGADCYLTRGTPTVEQDAGRLAFQSYRPDLRHVVCEFSLWDAPDQQDIAFNGVDQLYKNNPNFVGLFGFFSQSQNHDGRLSPEGRAVWDRMALDSAT